METTSIVDVDTLNTVWATIGQKLKATRESRGIEQSEIADYLKLNLRRIEALETGVLQNTLDAVFVKGFVRSYAKFLQIDLSDDLAQVSTYVPPDESRLKPVRPSNGTTYRNLRSWRRSIVVGLVALLAAAIYLGLNATRSSDPVVDSATDSAAASVNLAAANSTSEANAESAPNLSNDAPTAGSTSTSGATLNLAPNPAAGANSQAPVKASSVIKLKVEVLEDTWLQVVNAQNKIVFDQAYKAGEADEIEVSPPALILVGDVKRLRLQREGKKLTLQSNQGVGYFELNE